MSWFKIDDAFHCHPKAIAAGNAAIGLWTRFGSYAAHHLTDGFIPQKVATAYGLKRERDRLLTVRLLERGTHPVYGEGYWLHDFHDYNPTSDEVRAIRNARSEAGKRGGIRSGQTRRNEANGEANRQATAKQLLEAKTNPDPTRPISLHSCTDDPPYQTVPRPVDNYRGTRTDPHPIAATLADITRHRGIE